jgi:hypothetical protein
LVAAAVAEPWVARDTRLIAIKISSARQQVVPFVGFIDEVIGINDSEHGDLGAALFVFLVLGSLRRLACSACRCFASDILHAQLHLSWPHALKVSRINIRLAQPQRCNHMPSFLNSPKDTPCELPFSEIQTDIDDPNSSKASPNSINNAL